MIETGRDIPCEVVGFSGEYALLMPFGALEGVRRGCRALGRRRGAAVAGLARPRHQRDGRADRRQGTAAAGAVALRGFRNDPRYPAINVLKSVSRTMPRAADPAFLSAEVRARQVMVTYADMEELVRLGAYWAGSSAEADAAIRLYQPLEAFLAQGNDETTDLGQGYQRLEQILAALETEN